MKIKAQTDNRICIELTQEDMLELDITYDELDYSNIETRRVLWTLLDEARQELGKNISLTQKMLIEAIPDDNGGCTIYFTVTDEPHGRNGKKQLVKHGFSGVICQTKDIDNVTALASVLKVSAENVKSELFTDGEKYRLIIKSDFAMNRKLDVIACEYCDICDESVTAHTYEHWKLLASPDAIGVLDALY